MNSKAKPFSFRYLSYENRIQFKVMVIKKEETKEKNFNISSRTEDITFNRVKLQAVCVMKLHNI